MIKPFKVIVEKHRDGYVAYPLGLQGVVVGEGDTFEKALADVKSAIRFHLKTFGKEVLKVVRTMAPILVLGTRNHKKCQEIVAILGDLGLELCDLTHFPNAPEVEEDGATFEANSRKKARELAKVLNQWVLGEDSGLVVPALNGRPGVLSARYAGKQGDDDANNARLLAELAPLPDDRRAAFYVCTAALADPHGEIQAVALGRCHGVITKEARGAGGFGYDPLFLIPEYHRTFGELSSRVKHALSHRARALAKLRPFLHRLVSGAW